MNKRVKFFFNIFVLVVLLSSLSLRCKSSDGLINKNPVSANPYFPVKENSKWDYINEGPRDETELFSVSVTGIKENGKDLDVSFDSFPFFMKQKEQTELKIKPNGEVYALGKDSKENLFLPEPSKYQSGYTWQYGEWSAYVNSIDETVVTEKGTFEHCVFIGFSLGGITYATSIWLSKDTGIVKWASYRTNPPTLKPVYYVLK